MHTLVVRYLLYMAPGPTPGTRRILYLAKLLEECNTHKGSDYILKTLNRIVHCVDCKSEWLLRPHQAHAASLTWTSC